MRQSREVKAETRQAIIDHASRMFRERGIERTSVADVMQAADKTHGGFYRHFATKDELLTTALAAAFEERTATMEAGLSKTETAAVLDAFAQYYLASATVSDVGGGCPVAALAGDISRTRTEVRRSFGDGVRHFIDALARNLDGPTEESQTRAAQVFAMAAGALAIARASDAETAKIVLAAVRKGIRAL